MKANDYIENYPLTFTKGFVKKLNETFAIFDLMDEFSYDQKQEWYKKLWKKLHAIEQGEMELPEYIKEVESKIVDNTV